MADNLTTFMCRLSRNLGTSTSWNPVGLSRPVMGLLYLYLYVLVYITAILKVRNNSALKVLALTLFKVTLFDYVT
jgi:hypothetical protein